MQTIQVIPIYNIVRTCFEKHDPKAQTVEKLLSFDFISNSLEAHWEFRQINKILKNMKSNAENTLSQTESGNPGLLSLG